MLTHKKLLKNVKKVIFNIKLVTFALKIKNNMTVITRKIKLNVVGENKSDSWKTIWAWQRITHRAANLIVTHQFSMENMKEMIYLHDDVKLKLAKHTQEDDSGMLKCSRDNATYQICSHVYKGDIPMDIITNLNQQICKNYKDKKEHTELYAGKRSLRSYKSTIPIPFGSSSIRNLSYNEGIKNFQFDLFSLSLSTYLGKDLSGNKTIIERCLSGEYRILGSSLKIEENKSINSGKDNDGNAKKKSKVDGGKRSKYCLYLLLTVEFEKGKSLLNKDNVLSAFLSIDFPVILKRAADDAHPIEIGSKEDYIYKRLQIQSKLHNLQKACKYNSGGRGRSKKLSAIDRFKLKEKNYIKTKLHQYSKQIISYALKYGYGKIVLVDIDEKVKNAKDNPFILRNWTYYGFAELIKYKAQMEGIILDCGNILKVPKETILESEN